MKIHAFAAIIFLTVGLVNALCPPSCNCYGPTVFCGSAKLGYIPVVSSSTDYLELSFNDIKYINSSICKELPILRLLDLSNNLITEIPDVAFEDCTKLSNLYINSNFIIDIHAGTFRYLTSLNNLQIGHNHIDYLPSDTFNNLTSLEYIFLSGNRIRSIENYTFSNLINLSQLFEYNEPDFTTLRTRIKYIFKHGQSLGRKETLFSWLALFTKSQVNEVIGEIDKLQEFIKQELENHITDHNCKFPRDLLDVYLNLSESERKDSALSETNFFQAIIEMYMAAYETYTGAMMTLVFYLLKYPDVQKKCREEIQRVCRGKQTVMIEDRDKLRYVESTIKEVLRIAKPVVLAVYRNNPREIKVEKYTIPAKSIILFDLNDPQIDPKLWDHPNEFDPVRWTKPQKNGYLPFGIGPRQCVGAPTAELSLFFMITNILKKFELIPEDERNLPVEREWTGISLFPKPFKICMKPLE